MALYVSTETQYLDTGTSWGPANVRNAEYYRTKWNEDFSNNQIIQLKNDINFLDKFKFKNVYPKKTYLGWGESDLKADNIKNYFNNKKAVKNILNENL